MKLISSWLIRSSLALAAMAFVLSQGGAAEAASHHKTHQAKSHHAKVHHPRHRVAHARVRSRAPGQAQGYVQGIGPVRYGDGINGPPGGGAYTTYPTNDPSIGYFPGLWDAQRSGACIIDDGYGRWSGCDTD
jgi:hypothetical protein